MIIASPWSRGGCGCSQVFDHTSVLQFLETFLTHQTGKKIEEINITPWRRTVCGNLTSAFQPYQGAKMEVPAFPPRDTFIESIHQAKFKGLPSDYKGLTEAEIEQVGKAPASSTLIPRQEKGGRRACALLYQLYAEGTLSADRAQFVIRFEARNEVFGKHAAGSPFNVFAFGTSGERIMRAYAVAAGDSLSDAWAVNDFANGLYHLQVQGPNGFFREFKGTANDPLIEIEIAYAGTGKSLTGQVEVHLINRDSRSHLIEVRDNAYQIPARKLTLPAGGKTKWIVETRASHGWYDFSVHIAELETFAYRYAGRVETGKWSYSDPAMGRTIS